MGFMTSVNLFKPQKAMLNELNEKMPIISQSGIIRVAIEQFYNKMKARNFEL
jgi:hypothetical protein